MKKTQWINLFRDIRKTLVSFISISLFVALGIGIFLGIRWNRPAASVRINQYLNEHNYHDFLLSFPYGFTQEDIDTLSETDGISMAEGSYSAFGSSSVKNHRYVLVIQALTKNMDSADIIEGRMPEKADETGIELQFAEAAGIKPGDIITVNTENDGVSYLKNTEFTVTAIVGHPSYFSKNTVFTRGISNIGDGSVDYFVLMPEEAFDPEAYDNCYSQVLLRSDRLEGLECFGEEYEKESELMSGKIKEIGEVLAEKRCREIKERANAEISDAEKRLNDAEKELENGKKEISDGKTSISQAETDIAEGEKKIEDSGKELEEGSRQVKEGKTELSGAELEIAEAEKQIAENEKLLENSKNEYNNAWAEYKAKKDELDNAHTELQNSLAAAGFSNDIDAAETQMKDKRAELSEFLEQAERLNENIDRYHELLKNCNGDINALSPEDREQILNFLNQESGDYLDPVLTENLKSELYETSACLEKYINDPDSLTESESEKVNSLLEKSGFGADESGALKLKYCVDNAIAAIEICSADPELRDDTDFDNILFMMSLLGIKPDFEYMEELITSGKEKLQAKIQELNDGIGQLDSALEAIAEYRSGKDRISAAERELNAAYAKISEGNQSLNAAKRKLEEGKSELESKREELSEAEKKISDGRSELSEKKAELAEAKEQLEKSKQELLDAENKISTGQSELDEKNTELDEAKSRLDDFESYENWIVQNRRDNISYRTVEFYSESTTRLCFSMALLFVCVGLMVCYTSVMRNINEARILTGVQKALGFRRREITAYYMTYSMMAVLTGSVLGCVIGYLIIESIVNTSFMKLFDIGVIHNVFVLSDSLAIILVEILLICLATWIPCRKLFRLSAIDLIRGDNTGNGRTRFYEKFKLWNKLSLYTQTTVNNLVNDSSRVIATLVGISGCSALIVASMALQMSIHDTPKKHFSDVWLYDASVVYDNSVEGARDALEKVVEGENAECFSVMRTTVYIEGKNGELSKADLIVPESEDNMDKFICIKDWKTKKTLLLQSDGAVVSRTFQKNNNADVGDTVKIMDTKGVYHEFVISGVSEHYLSTIQITMSPEYYETVMLESPDCNTFYVNYGNADAASLKAKVQNADGFFSVTDECEKWTSVFMRLSSVTKVVVYVGLFLATVMAFMVLLNLNIVCVNEKSKELTIMRINGFSISAVKKYIYRDNIVLTIAGIIIGIISGIGLGKWIISTLQGNNDNFYTVPSPVTCIIAVVLTGLFALITNLIALSRIKNLNVHNLTR